jgi:hypothetical protein
MYIRTTSGRIHIMCNFCTELVSKNYIIFSITVSLNILIYRKKVAETCPDVAYLSCNLMKGNISHGNENTNTQLCATLILR